MNITAERSRQFGADATQSSTQEDDIWTRSWPALVGNQLWHLALTNGAGRVYPAVHNDLMVRLLSIAPHERVLDIGGGDAPFGRANVVTDAFPDMNAHRSGRAAQIDVGGETGVTFVPCFAEELPFADNAFDVAYCRMVLEHVLDPAAACREMMRVAKRGFLETPSPLAEYLGGHPTHRWIVWVERLPGEAPTLVFRRKPYRRAPLGYTLRGAWFQDDAFQFRWEWQYRNVVCTQLAWEGEFAFRVEDDGDGIDYDNPHQAAEAHLDAALCSLHWGDVPANVILPDIDYALKLRPEWALAHNARGVLLQREQRFAEACQAFVQAAQLAPDHPDFAYNAALNAEDLACTVPILVMAEPSAYGSPVPNLKRCAVTPGHLDHDIRLLLNLPPAGGMEHPLYARIKGKEEETRRRGDKEKIRDTRYEIPEAELLSTINYQLSTQDSSSFLLPPSSFALTWHAPLRDPSGYADEARHFLFALHQAQIKVAARAIRWSDKVAVLPPERERILQNLMRQPAQAEAVSVCHILAPLFQRDASARANIGRTMFETDRLPEGWADACNQMDAIWVPSRFNVETFAGAGVQREKLRVVPGAIDLAPYNPNCAPLQIEGARGFNFLAVFDWTLRKGWDVLIRAFVEEFRADDDAALILKTHSSLGYTGQQMLGCIADYISNNLKRDLNRIPDIVLQDANVPDARMPNLYQAADCYVMPSRGEGWGRPYMEAMAMGLPVIATGWSGQTEFMNADNSCVLDYEVVEVPEPAWRETPTYRGHKWAEPSFTHLRQLMRRAFEDRAAGRILGKAARAHLETHFTYASVAAKIAAEAEKVVSGQ